MVTTIEAYKLMHEGQMTFANMEANGICIDVPYLEKASRKTGERIAALEDRLRADRVWKAWQRRYGAKAGLGSRHQLSRVLHLDFGYEGVLQEDEDGVVKYKGDATVLADAKLPFLKTYIECEKLKKLKSTYIHGILRETVEGRLHPFFNLHTTLTYRSSGSDPNFQNIPIRDKLIGKIIRRAFIPTPGNILVELDYAAIEVRVAACYHKDPTMLKYIRDGYDMHRDMAAECYKLPKDQVPKDVRQQAKSLFVFAQFYGDYFVHCAAGLWDAITRYHLKTQDGVGLIEHLKSQGIKKRGACDPKGRPVKGTFEYHIKEVEDRFWNERFPVYAKWRKGWYNAYLANGGFNTLTGFHIDGVMSRNDVINYPVQGSAFHCLLWSAIQMDKWLRKNRMQTKLVGQIHDSLLADVAKDELSDYLGKAKEVMTHDLRKAWPWIITPLEIEAEGSDVNWYEKQPLKI